MAPREQGLFGASRMDAVEAEREEAAASLRQRMTVMRKASGGAGPAAIPQGGGAPLPGGVRSRMEPRLDADLSSVRVHTGGESAQAATSLGARAFTVGSDVHFGAGEFSPGSREGDKLLAHELTHVVQGERSGIQRKADEGAAPANGAADPAAASAPGAAAPGAAAPGATAAPTTGGAGADVSHPDEPAEKEADAVAEHVAGDLHGDSDKDKGAKKPPRKKKHHKKHHKHHKPHSHDDEEQKDAAAQDQAEDEKSEHEAKSAVAQQEGAAKAGEAKPAEAPPAAGAHAAPKIAAKLTGVGRKIFRATGASTSTSTTTATSTTPLAPPPNPQAKEIEAEFKLVQPVATLEAYNAMIQSLSLLVTAKSKASVNLRVTKLKDAVARTRAKLTEIYKDKAPKLVEEWIDSRLPKAHAKPGAEFVGKAATAKEALLKSPTVDARLQVDAAAPIVNYGICAPEEAATDQMMDESGGIMKVYDVGSLWWSMEAQYQDAWKAKFGSDADKRFTDACKAQKKLVVAPPGDEAKPPFRGAAVPSVFTRPLNGFVGQGKDAAAVGSFPDAIQRFALNPGYYPSQAMFVLSAPAADVKSKQKKGEIKIGKPSIFNLLNFDENVYKEDDRQYGHLADPKDPSKAGSALELTCQGYPSEIYSSAKFLG